MKKAVIIVAVLGVVGLLLATGWINLIQMQSYGIPFSVNTKTQIIQLKKDSHTDAGKPFIREVQTLQPEIFTHDKYIVSWLPKEFSQLITMRADFEYNPLWWNGFLDLGFFRTEGVALGRYYFTVDYIDMNKTEHRIIDTHNGVDAQGHMWDTNYVEVDKNRMIAMIPNFNWSTSTVTKSGGRFFHQGGGGFLLPNAVYRNTETEGAIWERVSVKNAPLNKWREAHSNTGWEILSTDTIEFHMKGLRTGALRVKYYIDTAQTGASESYKWVSWQLFAQDECYLASGAGEINIKSTGYIPGSPLQEPERKELINEKGQSTWGNWYTKYVFEENTTIQISVKTGYSGTSLSPGDEGYGDPWTLAIYNGKGQQVNEIKVADNFNGDIPYTIPKGAFVPGGNNEWKVVLKNTLFDVSEVVLFVVDSLQKVPGPVTVVLDKQQYKEGDTVTMSVSAVANPRGTGQISSFWVDVKYGSVSSLYRVEGFPKTLTAVKKTGTNLTYTATYTFPLENLRPVTMDRIYVRAHAIDSAGRAGVEGEKMGVYVEQNVPSVFGEQQWIPGTDNLLVVYAIIALIIIMIAVYLFVVLYQMKGSGEKIFKRRK